MADTPDEAALEVALGPKQVSVDGTNVTAQSIDEIKKAKDMLAANDAAGQTHFGLRMVQLVPPGCG
jgi:hypothetical protein